MNIIDETMIEFIKSRQRSIGFSPITFEYLGPSEEEKTYMRMDADGPNGDIFTVGKLLYDVNITEWYWMDRAPDRMVHRNSIYFKNEKDYTWFMLRYA